MNISLDGVVCQACRKDVTKALSDSRFVPRWSKHCEKKVCCIQQCHCKVFASLNKAQELIESAIHCSGLACSFPEVPIPAPLCKHHYHIVYNTVEPTQTNCVTCGMSLKHSTPKLCPNPELIEPHLKECVGFQGSIGKNDKVCSVCYRSHLLILQRQMQVQDRLCNKPVQL